MIFLEFSEISLGFFWIFFFFFWNFCGISWDYSWNFSGFFLGFSRIFLVFSGTLSGIFLEIFCVSFLEFSVLFLGFSGIFTPFPSCSFFFPPVPRREDERGWNSGNPPQSEALPGKNSILFLFLIFPGAQALPIKNSLGWNVQILGISSSCPFADIQERPKFFFFIPNKFNSSRNCLEKKNLDQGRNPSPHPNSQIQKFLKFPFTPALEFC